MNAKEHVIPSAVHSDRTAALADFLTALRPDTIPASALERAKALLLDHIGVCLQGADLPWSKLIARYAQDEGGRPEAVVYGGGRVPARMAALVNGTLAHGIELDDTHDVSCSHPGAVVFSAALAVGQVTGATGLQLLTAVVAGYEAMTRAGAALNGELMSRGFHPTALAGVFGASTAAALLMGFDSATLQSAWGLSVSMASGTMQFSEDSQGTMVKRLHGGLPAHNGVMAAQLATRGFRGPRGALDGKSGFIHIFSPEPHVEHLFQDLGTSWAIEHISIKLYACCRLFHAMIDSIAESRKQYAWEAADLVSGQAFGPALMSDGHMQYRPESVMAAQFSLPYCVAVALTGNPRDPASFAESALNNAEILSLADRITARVDPELQHHFPAKYGGGLDVHLRDGRKVSHKLLDSVGTPERPIDFSGIEDKFRVLTSTLIDRPTQAKIVRAVSALDQANNLDALAALLGRA